MAHTLTEYLPSAGPVPGRPPVPSFAGMRLALAAMALGGFAIGTTEFVAMGLLPQIAGGVDVTIPTAGHLISAYALGVVAGAPLIAGLGARLPRRTLLVTLMALYAVGNLASAFVPSYHVLLIGRFVSGLPHAAYFGVASLVAADLAGPGLRGRAVARVMLGLTVANVIGVPFATWLGQTFGWRAAFVAGAALAAITAVGVRRYVPWTGPDLHATPRREFSALRRPQVLLALATGAVGGGGMFAVYSYITPILTDRAGLALALVPVALAIWGLGMVVGGLGGGRLIDWRPIPTMLAGFVLMACLFAIFAVTSSNAVLAVLTVFFLGFALVLPTGLQMRLMDVAGDAQTLAAALNHSAFNLANALGAWLGGAVLAAGLGLAAPMWVAVGLTLAGMAIFLASIAIERRTDPG